MAFKIVMRLASRTWESQDSHLLFLKTLARVAGIITIPAHQDWILETALSQMKGRNVADTIIKGWLEVMASLIPNLRAQTVKEKVLPLALQRASHHTFNLKQRIISTVLLCSCTRRFPEDSALMQKLRAACQDTEALVRLCIVSQLPGLVGAAAEHRDSLSVILNEVRAMSYNKECSIL